MNPVDIITKPFTHERINKAIDKFGVKHVEYGLFNVAESSKKVSIHLPDILFIGTDDDDARNKTVVLKGGLRYILMNYSLDDIKNLAPHLMQVNRHELVALDIINNVTHDSVILKHADYDMPKEITLTNTHRTELAKKMFYK
jgi:DNA-binding LytR/AlgR family response regulator